MHPDVTPPEKKIHNGVFCQLISTKTKASLDIYFYVIVESDDFKTALEVALQFFPGIKLKRENRNCASKPACQTKRHPPQVFVRSGYQTGYFHLLALSIGQKTELALLRVFVELLQLHFHKCCLPMESLHLRDRWPRTGIELLGQAVEGVCGRERLKF